MLPDTGPGCESWAHWVTGRDLLASPVPEMVTVAVRLLPVVFPDAVRVMVAFPDPEDLLTTSQVLSEMTVQLVFEVILKDALLLFDPEMFIVAGEKDKVSDPTLVTPASVPSHLLPEASMAMDQT